MIRYLPFFKTAGGGGGGGGGITIFKGLRTTGVNTAPSGNPLTARNDFLAAFDSGSVAVETWPSSVPSGSGDSKTSTRNGITATFRCVQIVDDPGNPGNPLEQSFSVSITSATTNGRWNVTGDTGGKYLVLSSSLGTTGVYADPDVVFESIYAVVEFDSPVSVFGWYMTDVGDFSESVGATMRLYKSGGGTDDYSLNDVYTSSNGSLTFWGFVDTADTYTKIEYRLFQPGTYSNIEIDGFGVDDIVFCGPDYLL